MRHFVGDLKVEALISHNQSDYPQVVPKYPFINGLVCALFIMLGLGAVLDPTPQDLLPKVTGSLALGVAAGSLIYFTTSEHSQRQRAVSWILVAASVAVMAGIWLIR